MNLKYTVPHEDFRPRLIVWQLAGENGNESIGFTEGSKELTSYEAKAVLESIAQMAKPIIVFTGSHLLRKEYLYELVEHGHSLGLKMIIETSPEDITQELMKQYSVFGPRVFRVLLDHCIEEDYDTRFRRTTAYYTLDRCLRMLRSAGFEIHLGVTVKEPNIRALAFQHDYAFRKSARGLYCHLSLNRKNLPKGKRDGYTEEEIEAFIESIAKMKRYSPDSMYFSPQCVQYGFVGYGEGSFEHQKHDEKPFEWKHVCLGGKRFAYITASGGVQICSGLDASAGDLRMTGFDFQEIWESSEIFREQRENGKACTETRKEIREEYPDDFLKELEPNVEYIP
ncbi:MAG: hypothetical protein EPO24_00055 [Bacteroidetes bacterium]|nr:MAG: hypothetical protein EPO24_00055 [Bacteroidota bacterium]